uniref:Integrase catalytic domain-containing protein n=1 Tax=Strongyloides papillosus TaxID=174720 RepID=A0A0N5BLY3_STREA
MYSGTIDSRRKTKSSDYCHNISSPVDRTVDSCHSCLTMRKFPYKLYASWVTATHLRQISSLYACYVSNSTLIMLVDYLFNFMYGQVLPDQFSQAIIKFLSPTMDEYPLFILIYDAESALTSDTLSEFFSSYRIGFHSNLQPSNTQKITSIKYRLKSNGRNEGHINSLHKTFQKADLLNILPFQRLQWATIPLNTSLSRTKNSNGGNQFLLPAEKYYLDWSVILLKLPTFEECAPSSLHTSYTLSDSILLSNNKSTVKVPESSLTTPPFFPPECQHALDESLDKSHVEIYLNSLQPSINVQKVVINVDCDYASDTASYDWYEREFDKKGKYPHSNLWKQIADLMPSSYWAYHCIRDVFPLHMIIRKSF